jgi:hypothetical protein
MSIVQRRIVLSCGVVGSAALVVAALGACGQDQGRADEPTARVASAVKPEGGGGGGGGGGGNGASAHAPGFSWLDATGAQVSVVGAPAAGYLPGVAQPGDVPTVLSLNDTSLGFPVVWATDGLTGVFPATRVVNTFYAAQNADGTCSGDTYVQVLANVSFAVVPSSAGSGGTSSSGSSSGGSTSSGGSSSGGSTGGGGSSSGSSSGVVCAGSSSGVVSCGTAPFVCPAGAAGVVTAMVQYVSYGNSGTCAQLAQPVLATDQTTCVALGAAPTLNLPLQPVFVP